MTHEITMSAQREKDAVIMVCQDNSRKGIYIEGLNKAAEDLLGYGEDSVIGEELVKIMNGNIIRSIREDIEYEFMGDDLGNVLSKVRGFNIVDSDMNIKKVDSKIFTTASGDGKMHYELLLRDLSIKEKFRMFTDSLVNDLGSKVVDGILNLHSIDEIDHLIKFFNNEGASGVFALMGVDQKRSEKDNEDTLMKLIKALSGSIRNSDLMFRYKQDKLLFSLINCKEEYVNNALSRIHKQINKVCDNEATGILGGHVTTSMGYVMLDQDMVAHSLLQGLENNLEKALKNGGHQICGE